MLRHALRRAARIKGRPLSEAAAVATPKVPQPPVPPVDDDAALTPRKICDELELILSGKTRRSAPSPSLFAIDGAANYSERN